MKAETGRRKTIEVTEEMISAAARELALFDPDYASVRQGAERLLTRSLHASGFEVCKSDRLTSQ